MGHTTYSTSIAGLRWLTSPRSDAEQVLQFGLRQIHGGELHWFNVEPVVAAPAERELANGLTEAQTSQTASVAGLEPAGSGLMNLAAEDATRKEWLAAVEALRAIRRPDMQIRKAIEALHGYGEACWRAGSAAIPAARAVIAHWHEFGPEHGFDEAIDHLDAALKRQAATDGETAR